MQSKSQVSRSVLVLGALFSLGLGCAKEPVPEGGSGGQPGTGSGGTSGGTGTGGTTGGSGSGGSTGSTGSGGATPITKDPSTYTQTAGAKYPFPQNHRFTACPNFPIYNTDEVYRAYKNWKTKMYVGGRVVRPENGNDTVSEGIAYGMLAAVYVNDQSVFDTLWSYAQSHKNGNGFMNWHIDANGGTAGANGATDADEDMAWALLMAAQQWGTSKSYMQQAQTLIQAIWDHEVDHGGGEVLKPGDQFGGAGQTNPSYFAPSYYRVFGQVTNNVSGWNAVIDKSYQILAAASGTYGLVPDWTDGNGNPHSMGPNFGYDACRIPWRIAVDYCQNGEPRAKAYLEKLNAFIGTKRLDQLRDGYTTSGGDPSGTLGDYIGGMAFYGPEGTSAMTGTATADLAFMRTSYQSLAGATSDTYINKIDTFSYYHASWGVLSMLMMSGNFWDMSHP